MLDLQVFNDFLGLEVLDPHEQAVHDVVHIWANSTSHARVHVVHANTHAKVEGEAASKTGGNGHCVLSEGH